MNFLLLLAAALAFIVEVVAAANQPATGCPTSCGDISIPFPFGISSDCSLNSSFVIICNNTFTPPKPFVGNLQVSNITLHGQLKVLFSMAYDCYDRLGLMTNDVSARLRSGSFFTISPSDNIFTVVGCDTYAYVQGIQQSNNYTTGCMAFCNQMERIENGSCSIGCCQMSITAVATEFLITVNSFWNHTRVMDVNPCGYAFVSEKGYYNFSSADLVDLRLKATDRSLPVVLDWAVSDLTCEQAQQDLSIYACSSESSECHDSLTRSGYLCSCLPGFQGNPYIINGCQDINECDTSPCSMNCENTPGNFSCFCPKGYEGDGMKNGDGCRRIPQSRSRILLFIPLGVVFSIALLLAVSSWVHCVLRDRKLTKLKEKFFKQNGGFLLQQKLSTQNGSMQRNITFSEEDLKMATDNYDNSRIIGEGGFGTVYKGVLPDKKEVAIKMSKVSDQSQIEQFINEVIILSQINHKNVVELLGCCLETKVPLLVYEFITNGTLHSHIHDDHLASSFTWDLRLKIAAQTAGALSYLHSWASVPVIHRDIKTVNILLDSSYNAKVSDFGASRFIPTDQVQVATLVQGTFGYLDPEYFHSGQLTEKSDVYSFGVVLAELITAKSAISFSQSEKTKNLAMDFVSSVEQNKLFDIIDKRLLGDRNVEQIKEVAIMSKRCLHVKSEERPTMKEVAMELEGLMLMHSHPWVNQTDMYPEETELLLDSSASHTSQLYESFDGISASNGRSGFDSMKDQIIVPVHGGR